MQLGALTDLEYFDVDLTTLPNFGYMFTEHGCQTNWRFCLRNSVGAALSLILNPDVAGADGEHVDWFGVNKTELSGCLGVQKQREAGGFDASQRMLNFVYFVDSAGVGATMHRSMRPIMVTAAQLSREARARDEGAALVGYVLACRSVALCPHRCQ